MTSVLLIIWLLAVIYTVVSLIKPLPPFRTRLRTLGFGTTGLVVSFFGIAIIIGVAGIYDQEKTKGPAVTTSKPAKQPKNIVVKPSEPVRNRTPNLGIVALTHFNRILKKRVTYKKPRNFRLFKDEFSKNE